MPDRRKKDRRHWDYGPYDPIRGFRGPFHRPELRKRERRKPEKGVPF